jgi:carbamoyltransferase
VGLSGSGRDACVALGTPERILGVCPQERITRLRAAGVNQTGLPDEALDELLRRSGRQRHDVTTYAGSGSDQLPRDASVVRLDRHHASACAAFLPSRFDSAVVVVCDLEPPYVSVWEGNGQDVSRVDWPWHGPGLAGLYADCAAVLGFSPGSEQRMEALARLHPSHRADWAEPLFGVADDRLTVHAGWRDEIAARVGRDADRARTAAAVQSRLADLLLDWLARVRRRVPSPSRLCLGGRLFYNSHFNSEVRQRSSFDEVFVPVDPGHAGVSLGLMLDVTRQPRQAVTPFLGPSYDLEDVKKTLDNCKLTYRLLSDADSIGAAVDALGKGHLVAWFDGPMEFGPRALGARSILASPFGPYVLDNLNRFLKHREMWRGYALSGTEDAVAGCFDGPSTSPFMECDYLPRDRDRFRHVLPEPGAAIRLQTAGPEAPARFRALLDAFGQAAGASILVNTSFNGFREPIVCHPRDAIRVFFGTGIDMLVLGRFVLTK